MPAPDAGQEDIVSMLHHLPRLRSLEAEGFVVTPDLTDALSSLLEDYQGLVP